MKILLLVLSRIYGLVTLIRNQLYDLGVLPVYELPGVVISIGNIAAGGTGKSPVVIDLARNLERSGHQPVVVTRGYRSGLKRDEWQVLLGGHVIMGQDGPDINADEARMQSMALPNVPIIVGARRYRAVSAYLEKSKSRAFSHFILDDGFQHRQIKRQYNLVLMDAREPMGPILPLGRFREGARALRRATGVILTKANDARQVSEAKRIIEAIVPGLPVIECRQEGLPPRLCCGQDIGPISRWCAVAGIAKPDDFLRTLAAYHIEPSLKFFAGDHHSFDDEAVKSRRSEFDAVITTEKDWARDYERFQQLGCPVFVLPLSLIWAGDRSKLFGI